MKQWTKEIFESLSIGKYYLPTRPYPWWTDGFDCLVFDSH